MYFTDVMFQIEVPQRMSQHETSGRHFQKAPKENFRRKKKSLSCNTENKNKTKVK